MLILAHRGYHEHVPENTLDAFAAAMSLGVDGIETDIRLSSDGIPVLLHDRVIAGVDLVARLSVDELSARLGHPVATLHDALTQFPNILWNLEIKTPSAVAPTIAVLKQFIAERQILVSSFWHTVVADVCGQLDIDGAVLVAHCPLAAADVTRWLPPQPRVRSIVWHTETLSPTVLREAQANGLRSFVYGAETQDELEALSQMGVDGVITDHPDRIMRPAAAGS